MTTKDHPRRVAEIFNPDADRKPVRQSDPKTKTPLQRLAADVGKRYAEVDFDNFTTHRSEQRQAVIDCIQYGSQFADHFTAGRNLVLAGPAGTGKDHLLIGTLKAVLNKTKANVCYRTGLRLFDEFRQAIDSKRENEQHVLTKYLQPALLAISDPSPPVGELSHYEKRMFLRLVDWRYRELRPMAFTCNVKNREELESQLGVQATDRILETAVVVKCFWNSYRKREPLGNESQ